MRLLSSFSIERLCPDTIQPRRRSSGVPTRPGSRASMPVIKQPLLQRSKSKKSSPVLLVKSNQVVNSRGLIMLSSGVSFSAKYLEMANTQNMDLLGNLEIYIPVEAEVKSIPLRSLPKSVLRRMGFPLSEGSRTLTDSPEGIWICPAVIRRKGQKLASHTGSNAIESMSSLLGREFQAVTGPFQMSFLSANYTAYKVLKDTMPGKAVSSYTSHTSLLPQGSAPRTYKDAIVIYHGCIYLSSKKRRQRRTKQKTQEPQLESQSSSPSTSASSRKSQNKRQAAQVSREPADKELPRKKFRATLPQTSPEQIKDRLIKTDNYSTTDQELLNENRTKKKHTTLKVPHSKNKKNAMHKRVFKVYSHCHKDTDGEWAAEEAAGTEPTWFQPQGEQEEVANNNGDEREELDLGDEEADYIQMDSGEPDNIAFVEQSSGHSWTRRESEAVASASTSLQEFDFKALAEEEKIAQMKAKLRRSEAALNNLHTS